MVESFRSRYILYIVTAELQTVNVAYFQRKIQLSGFATYPDGWPSKLIVISGVGNDNGNGKPLLHRIISSTNFNLLAPEFGI